MVSMIPRGERFEFAINLITAINNRLITARNNSLLVILDENLNYNDRSSKYNECLYFFRHCEIIKLLQIQKIIESRSQSSERDRFSASNSN